MRWLERFLDWTETQHCRVCGASLRDARVVIEREAAAGWRASIHCRSCRALNTADIPEAA